MRVPLVLAAAASTVAFTNLGPGLLRLPSTPPASAASRRRPRLASTPVSEMSSTMADIRKQMEEDEEVNLMMQGLRGANLNDDDNAAAGVTMRLVTTRDGGELPTYYSPDALRAHFKDRPGEVAQRVFQIATTSAGFLGTLLFDAATGRLESNEVGRAAEVRSAVVVVVAVVVAGVLATPRCRVDRHRPAPPRHRPQLTPTSPLAPRRHHVPGSLLHQARPSPIDPARPPLASGHGRAPAAVRQGPELRQQAGVLVHL